jgi:hypothetical protein
MDVSLTSLMMIIIIETIDGKVARDLLSMMKMMDLMQ